MNFNAAFFNAGKEARMLSLVSSSKVQEMPAVPDSNAEDEFRRQYGPEYRADLALIFPNPDGTPFKPDSISAAVSLLFRRLKLPKGASLHSLRCGICTAILRTARGIRSLSLTMMVWSSGIAGP